MTIKQYKEDGKLKTLAEVEEEHIAFALQTFGLNVSRTAKALGIARTTMYRRAHAVLQKDELERLKR